MSEQSVPPITLSKGQYEEFGRGFLSRYLALGYGTLPKREIDVLIFHLISTAKGQGVDIFGLFEVPAFLSDSKDRGELAGDVHEWIGLGFILLVALHAFAALLHHFKYKDRTLKRMLGVKK